MNFSRSRQPLLNRWLAGPLFFLLILGLSPFVQGQVCLTATDMDASAKTALTTAAQRFFEMAVHGDAAGLRENAVPSIATNFGGIERAIKDNQADLTGANGNARSPFLLKADGSAPLQRAEFLCGVFGANGQTSDSVVFVLSNLPPGTYAVETFDVSSPKPYTVTFVLQQLNGVWKLGGYYAKVSKINGHDGQWFAQQARDFKAKGQLRDAWFYHLQAREMLVPVPFMSTLTTDKLFDEFQGSKPADLPPADLSVGGKSLHVIDMFPLAVGDSLDLVVRYQTASVADTGQTFQDNVAAMKALLLKYPEFRNAFDGVIARAVESSGRDYGTMLPMKDIK